MFVHEQPEHGESTVADNTEYQWRRYEICTIKPEVLIVKNETLASLCRVQRASLERR